MSKIRVSQIYLRVLKRILKRKQAKRSFYYQSERRDYLSSQGVQAHRQALASSQHAS